ncbi:MULTISPECIES: hypothetical protein [unclassified Streptomyces]|uniref:hypothetical protein n=1 Tax=unclassified Streptomyces TaxID=2593676 RepID=UPI001F03D5B0|nr:MULTISPECIES: hypothetical protein [unclassified Streptomyces]MCH0563143.1 hypothetical protein [Streptomyces sp. MUM 2J]MCH0568572.1 hypothetical protein [Streptomyces sp. MUM 136J]
MWGAALAALGAVGAASPVGAADPGADLAYHGVAAMAWGRVEVGLTPRNHGPSGVPDATVRLRWSVPLAVRQPWLPAGCVRTADRDVMCRTGELEADGIGERIELAVRLRGRPSEVRLRIDTVWGGGAVDRNRDNDRQQVLVLDTGDAYTF